MAAHLLILFNQPILPPDHPESEAEQEVLHTVRHVSTHLQHAGFEVEALGLARDVTPFLERVRQRRPDAVFNLFEGLGDDSQTEVAVAALLEWLRLPFTGSPSQALAVARSKPLTKWLLQGAGLPTAPFFLVEDDPGELSCPLDWPVIVKPAAQDASVGIDHDSVVDSLPRLRQRVRHVWQRYGPPVLVERYIPGRELTVGIVETPHRLALPASEFLFQPRASGVWPIVTYDAKWSATSEDFRATTFEEYAQLPAEQTRLLQSLALRVYGLLGLRDYGRVDFRLTPSGEAYILEVNPNPDLSPDAGLAGVLAAAGLTHDQLIVELARRALARDTQTRKNREKW